MTDNKEAVRICSWCQHINDNNEHMKKLAEVIPQNVRDELSIVNQQIIANKGIVHFTHGVCVPHYLQQLEEIPGLNDIQIKNMVDKAQNGDPPPCLINNAQLRHQYMQGLFTKEQIQQAFQTQQAAQQKLTERFQKLAGIVHS